MTILEATSGNTGIALAMVGAALGYRTLLALPESVSAERKHTMEALGAKVILTPAHKGTDGAIEEVERISQGDTAKGTNLSSFPTSTPTTPTGSATTNQLPWRYSARHGATYRPLWREWAPGAPSWATAAGSDTRT